MLPLFDRKSPIREYDLSTVTYTFSDVLHIQEMERALTSVLCLALLVALAACNLDDRCAFKGPSRKIYVGGLPYDTTDTQLRELFATYGTVESARVITDKFSGRSRGFGFVEMATTQAAQNAIQALNGTRHGGRDLTVNEARPQEGVSNRRRCIKHITTRSCGTSNTIPA